MSAPKSALLVSCLITCVTTVSHPKAASTVYVNVVSELYVLPCIEMTSPRQSKLDLLIEVLAFNRTRKVLDF